VSYNEGVVLHVVHHAILGPYKPQSVALEGQDGVDVRSVPHMPLALADVASGSGDTEEDGSRMKKQYTMAIGRGL
jgi:hypothetical protein